MLSLFNFFGFVRYIFFSISCGVIPRRLVVFGRPIFMLGFKRIKFGGFNKIFPGSRFEIFHGGKIQVGFGVQIGQYCHITCANEIIIGDNTAIAGGAVITDIHHPIAPVSMPPLERPYKVRPVYIGNSCFIGYGAVVLPGSIIGDGCYIGANVVVRGVVAAGTVLK